MGSHRRREVLAALAGVVAMGAAPSARARGREFSFGLTPVFLTSDLELLSRLRAYLERALGGAVRLVTRRTYQEITSLLISGQLDAAWICGFPFVALRESLALVAVPLWKGQPLYRSYLIVDKSRPATSLADLEGDAHAFSDPDSNSGWLVTAAELAARGSTPEKFFSRSIFTYGHRNVVRAVASGLAQSGSVDGYVYDVMKEIEPALVGSTRVVWRSGELGFPPVACAAHAFGAPRVEALRRALVAMAGDEDGRGVLSLLRLDGFSVQPPSLYDRIAEEVAVVRRAAG